MWLILLFFDRVNIMKKLISITSILTFFLLFFTSCDNTFILKGRVQEDKTKTTVSLKNVSNLFIVNPTDNTKEYNENWISISSSSRQAYDEDDFSDENSNILLNASKNMVQHTLPYTFDSTVLVSNASREAAATVKKTVGYKTGDTHVFSEDDIMKERKGVMRYEGQYCYVWTLLDEDEESAMTDDEIKTLAKKFDELYVKETELCGPKFDGVTPYYNIIPANEKISLLLFDIYEDKDEGNLLGYFSQNNYLTDNQSGINMIELLCLDSYFAKHEDYASGFYDTMVHEFNHMLNFANKTLKYGLEMETWYTEMLSMLTEDCFYEELQPDYNNSIYYRLELFIAGGYAIGFKNWTDINSDGIEIYCNYSNAYAFGAYLARNYGGAELIHEIATNAYTNEKSIVKAIKTVCNVDVTFEDLLTEFCYVLVNVQGQNSGKPTLYKSSSKKLGDYTFNLPIINLDNLNEQQEVFISPVTKTPSETFKAVKYMDGYGFHYYKYENPENLSVRMKNFLVYDYE